jgi:hypothetical protein
MQLHKEAILATLHHGHNLHRIKAEGRREEFILHLPKESVRVMSRKILSY